MSADGPGRREVAHRLFAAEFDDASFSYSESDEERAPNYVVTPTGARVNRLFAVGVLTEVESVNEDVLRGRIVDPTGAFVTYAGQYQPDAMSYLDRTEPPAFVALTGKARTFEPDDSDRVFTSIRPESVNAVDADTRDRWVAAAAEATLERVGAFSTALETDLRGDELAAALREAGVRESLSEGIPLALERYGTTTAYLDAVRRTALDAVAVVADERDAVRSLDVAPDEGGDAELGPMPDLGRAASPADVETAGRSTAESDSAPADDEAAVGAAAADPEAESPVAEGKPRPTEATTEAASETEAAEPASDAPVEPEATTVESGSTPAEGEPESAAEPEPDSEPAEGETEVGAESETADSEPLGDFDDLGEFEDSDGADVEGDADDMYELDEAERQEVRSEFGTEFSTGNEVDDPGEADIDVPDPDERDADGADAASDPAGGAEPSAGADGETVGNGDATAEAAEDADLESAAVEVMDEIDGGDGADREAVVAAVVDRYGADPEAVEDAIQSALMSGRCYEPGEETLKAI